MLFQKEPNIRLHRLVEKTAEVYKEARNFKEKEEKSFKEDINGLEIPDGLKKWLKDDPARLLDLSVHSDVTAQEVAKEIIGEITPKNLNQFQELNQKIQSAVPVLEKYFRENQERFLNFLEAYDWIENNDLKPFLEAYAEGGKADQNLKRREEERIIREIEKEVKESRPKEGKKQLINREMLLKKEQELVKKALEIFEGRVNLEPDIGLVVSKISKSELDNLDTLIQQLAFPLDVSPEGPLAERVSFIRDLKEPKDEVIRKYLSLKAIEAALHLELSDFAQGR
jgi:hypothetical protein